jgi:hypothetical protein
MNNLQKQTRVDLSTMTEIMEDFVTNLSKMKEPDKIDLAARLKPIAKACETIDKDVKKLVKEKRNGKEGSVLGVLFKAVLSKVPTHRFNQAAFKEDHPKYFEQYNEDVTDERITFELR